MSETTPLPADAATAPNVRLRTNVVCLRVFGSDHRTPALDRWYSSPEVHDQLFFWDLLELSRRFYNHIPSERTKEAQLTPRQLAERHAFLRTGADGGSLWQTRQGAYRPITTERPIKPFYERPAPPVLEPTPGEPKEAGRAAPVVAEGNVPAPAITPPALQPAPAAPKKQYQPETLTSPVVTPPQPAPSLPVLPVPVDEPQVPLPAATRRDDDQEAVVSAPMNKCMLVLAPPGTGKTHTLIRRIQHLVETGQATGSNAITVLSFTRAAVAEIVARIATAVGQGAADNLRYVTVRTFDSFASQMLRLDLSPQEMPAGYEPRIQRLHEGLHRHSLPKAAEEIDKIKCLLIDEVQDLVGHRAEMVLTLMRRVEGSGGGVVLLGDFAQAMYDYQLKGKTGQRSSAGFLEYVQNYFSEGGLSRHELKHNYRVTCESMRRFVASARSAMGDLGTMPDGQQLGGLLQQLGAHETLNTMVAAKDDQRVAVLTRSKLHAFHFSEWCRSRSIPCSVVQGAASSYCSGWIGRLVMGWASPMMSRDDAGLRWAGLIGERVGISFDEAFGRLQSARVVVNGQIDMAALSRAVTENRQELASQNTGVRGMYVSTIHRSKGLEFDEVYLLDPSGKKATWQGNPEEVRVVYVAATRAKSKMALLRADDKALGMGKLMWKSPIKSHSHEYDAVTGQNRIFLDGLSELDSDSLLADLPGASGSSCKDRIISRQEALWEHFVRGNCTLDAFFLGPQLVFTVPGEDGSQVPICQSNTKLSSDVAALGWAHKLNLLGVTGTPLYSLATLAFPADDDEATEYLGPSRLVTAPVLWGWGTVC